MHNSCCACAYQLLCKRTTAVVRPKILTVSTTYPISSNNISYLIQQHILSHLTTYPISSNNKKRVNHKLMTHPHVSTGLFKFVCDLNGKLVISFLKLRNRLKNVVSLSLRHLYNPFHVVFILPSTIEAKP